MKTLKIVRGCVGVIVGGLLATSVLVLIALGIGPRTGAYGTLTVLTGSMDPAIPAGSVIIVTPQRSRDVRVGQIITYQIPVEDHRVVTHRVVEVITPGANPVIRTKGDANEAPDPWVSRVADPTAWKVRAVVPHLGTAIRWFRQPVVQRLSLAAVPAILALVWLMDIWRPRRELEVGTCA